MHHPPATRHGHGHDAPPPAASWAPLALLVVAQFMVVLDITVVNVALPSIGDALHVAGSRLQWVVTAYVLLTGGLMLFGGRLADLAGRRTVFLAGLGLFTGASLASGAASSASLLVGARALQGAGAALLLPAALSLVTTIYAGHQRAKALAVWGTVGSAGAAAGVVLGGALTEALGWRAIFFVNVPIGLAVAAAAMRTLPGLPGAGVRGGRLDVAGAATLVAGLVTLVLAIENTADHGWMSASTLAMAALAVSLLGRFAAVERTAARPLVDPATWRNRPLVTGAGVMLVATGILVGALFLGALVLQRAMGASPLEAGVGLLPLAVAILGGVHVASHLLPRLGSRWTVVAGLLVAAGGATQLASAPGDPSYAAHLLPGLVVLGAGVGATFVAVSVAAMADVEPEQAGLASGLMTTAHELGAALGVAVLGAIVAAALNGGGGADLVDGCDTAFLVAGNVAAAAALVAALTLPSVRPQPGVAHGIH
ncbi:MAG TPA: MFS transporter [Baekduia sp.]|nr:MFS transporter [Baekduia sp.]